MNLQDDETLIITDTELNKPAFISIIVVVIIFFQLSLSGFIPFLILSVSFNTQIDILIFGVRIVLSSLFFIFTFLFLQGLTNKILLKTMKHSYTRNILLGNASISTALILPYITTEMGRNFFTRLFGAKIGNNVTICFGAKLLEPHLIEIGDNTYIGGYTIISGHLKDRKQFILKRIKIGRNVFIGGLCGIMPGVEIMDNSTIGSMSLVTKNKRIPPNQVWAGIPAKKLEK